ncbi:hypothetical protein E3N88_21442 [Mikania micrantha]|uniref:Reverse transcriptase domain-containing protein n=1 Tax=Mikania micrantha TaxID=192012 RepID=A0A5N6NL73_9ASTR|nr:hypothetical protein E3N88_21442 [Mikania micrantha]
MALWPPLGHDEKLLGPKWAQARFVGPKVSMNCRNHGWARNWLSNNQAEVVCQNKVIRIPLPNGNTLIVQGERAGRKLGIISCMQAQKFLRKGCYAFLAHVTEHNSSPKQITDIPVVKDFPEVFPEDISGLPPVRQVEFRIDLIPGAAPVAKAPYRLAPSEMQELSGQLQELLDKGNSIN